MKSIVIMIFLLLTVVFAYATGNNSESQQLRSAASHFKKQYFNSKIQDVIIRPDQNLWNFLSGFFPSWREEEMDEQPGKGEKTFDVRLELRTSDRTFVLRPCKISDRVQCGWMVMNCYENKFSASPAIAEFTREGSRTLVYTYDKVKASLCAKRQANFQSIVPEKTF